MAHHVLRRYRQLLREEAREPARVRVAERPDRHDVLLGIQLQAVAHAGVEVNRELRDPQQGPVNPHQPHLGTFGRAHHHPAGQPQIAIEPRIEQRAAVDLDAELPDAGAAGIRPGLDPERRAVGMRAEQPEPGAGGRARRDDPGEQRPALGHDVAAGTGWPRLRLGHFGEPGHGQPAQGLGGGVIRRRRGVDEPDEVEGGFPGAAHRSILAGELLNHWVRRQTTGAAGRFGRWTAGRGAHRFGAAPEQLPLSLSRIRSARTRRGRPPRGPGGPPICPGAMRP